MMARRHPRTLGSGIAALALTAALAGCGTGDDPEPAGDSTTSSQTPAQPEPSGTMEPSTPDPSEKTSATAAPETEAAAAATENQTTDAARPTEAQRAHGIVGELLTAGELPGFNDEFTWQEKSTTRREGGRPFATCAKFAMTSVGAMKVAVRSYEAADGSSGSSASNLVARFADEMTAKRAYEVLKSWREQCAEELQRYDRAEVGRLESVPLDSEDAVGNWYLLTYGPPNAADAAGADAGYFDAQGLTRVGSTISLAQMRLVGQDYNYPAGKEPMVTAVQEAAANLG